MRRFFIEPEGISGDQATIGAQEARHISTVLRLKPGHRIELFDGTGQVYLAEIAALNRSTVTTRIISRQLLTAQPPFLHAAQAVVKGKKMDLVIQKATELGASTFQPIISRHCDIKTVSPCQTDRWQRIAFESCKQCNRPTPLRCHPAIGLDEFIAQAPSEAAKIILWENEETGDLAQLLSPPLEHTIILIGPEGGFGESEVETALRQGFRPASLGPRTLRAETAAIAAIAIIQFVLGNLRKGA